jgi:glycosyltransferase involved in cell wall biosynthesis
MKRILFYSPALGGGGAEMHLLRVANALGAIAPELELSVAVNRRGGDYEARLDPKVRILPALGKQSWPFGYSKALREVLKTEKPDVLFSILEYANVPALLAARGLPTETICSVQSHFAMHPGDPWQRRVTLGMAKRLYPQATVLMSLSTGVANDLRESVGVSNVPVIPNIAVDTQMDALSREPLPDEVARRPELPLRVVACGRLIPQKGFDVLLRSFAELRQSVPAELVIAGRGRLQADLEAQIAQLGLEGSARLLGFQRNPFAIFRNSDLFALSSRWEGFANVVPEAMYCGCPAVVTDCPHGPAEIVNDGEYGRVVPMENAGALAAAMREVLSDADVRADLAEKGRRRSLMYTAEALGPSYRRLMSDPKGFRPD